ncbi:DnaT DNA-binding domain protein [compost metagenome]
MLYGTEKGQCEPLTYTPMSGRKPGPTVELLAAEQGPIWFSPRMVRDEYVRTHRGTSSRFGGGNGDDPGHSPKGGFGDGKGAAPKRAPSPRQGDGSTSSPSSSSSPSVANATSVDARQRFEMHEAWQPDEMSLKTQLKMAGMPSAAITDALVSEFVAFWINRDTADNQGGWCHRLVQHAKRQAVRAAASPMAGAPAPDWAEEEIIL